jgi:glycosyltransferase involved in cell wall biosynthesis
LDSILQQDYGDFELIISDNASTDRTEEICQELAAKDKRIRYSRNQTNIGSSGNYARVFELAQGEYFKWAAHDDMCRPQFLSRCIETFSEAPDAVVLVAPMVALIDSEGLPSTVVLPFERLHTRALSPRRRFRHVLSNVQWAPAAYGLFRRAALKKTRLIGPYLGSDCVLLAEIALLGEIWEIPEVLTHRRFHPEISTTANRRNHDLLHWFDPARKRGWDLVSPRLRILLEYIRSVSRAPISRTQRLSCMAIVLETWSRRESARALAATRDVLAIRTRMRRLTHRVSGAPALRRRASK